MSKTAIIQARVEPETKKEAQKVLQKLNISMSEAVSIFLTQVSLNRGIPFEIKIPNKITKKTMADSQKNKDLNEVSSLDQLFKELED
ncbi:MAG: type II toxin-antitoxin system RelB/DinJ family antitoxin [Desulforegulaceae bacterium]|nr:type II toxin-antitoxin system RelB/DinJ family antitoxin [Desulforegulaceae bacterium]